MTSSTPILLVLVLMAITISSTASRSTTTTITTTTTGHSSSPSPPPPPPSYQQGGTKRSNKFRSRRGVVPVTVGTKHHHVLRHWYESVNKKILPRYNATVLHFDTHADIFLPDRDLEDDDPPPLQDDEFLALAGNYWPTTEKQYAKVIESCEIATFFPVSWWHGVTSRYVWIRSDFEPVDPDARPANLYNAPQAGSHTIEIGFNRKGFMCFQDDRAQQHMEGRRCKRDQMVKPVREVTLRTMVVGAALNESVFRVEAMRPGPQGGEEPVPLILDIDLDYFTSHEDPLREGMEKAGLPLEWAQRYDKLTLECQTTCCRPRWSQQFNYIVMRVLQIFGRTDLRKEDDAFFVSYKYEQKELVAKRERMKTHPGDFRALVADDTDGCTDRVTFFEKLKLLAHELSPWNRLRLLGVFYKFQVVEDPEDQRRIIGKGPFFMGSEPNHMASSAEIVQRVDEIRHLIVQMGERIDQIKLVTVTRSMKDGYLPKHLWPEVEWRTLCMLQDVFGDVGTKADFVFDKTISKLAPKVDGATCKLYRTHFKSKKGGSDDDDGDDDDDDDDDDD